MILATTIQKRLSKVVENPKNLVYDFDIRYLQRWVNLYPQCFPKFVLSGNYEAKIVWNKQGTDFNWQIHKL